MSIVKASIGKQVHSFSDYPTSQISRSKFDRSHSLITTLNAGYIVPIWHDQAYPGDTLDISVSSFTRLMTQIVPFMSNVYMDIHFWCVPNRLIWEHWTAMHGERPNPDDSIDYLTPQIEIPAGGSPALSIYDYFDIPNGSQITSSFKVNAFNFRAYNLVYNEWYRDENLQNRVPQVVGDTDLYSNYTLLKRGRRKNYFYSLLPQPQKGATVDLPLGEFAPVIGNGQSLGLTVKTGSNTTGITDASVANLSYAANGAAVITGRSALLPVGTADGSTSSYFINNYHTTIGVHDDANSSGLIADLSSATAATINTLRQAFAIQKLLECDARSGTRYIEQILGHFHIKSPDARLQRPEFLGGGTFVLDLNVVPQTSKSETNAPLGELASYGIINGKTKRIFHSFTEHCIVFAVCSIRPEYYFQQGLDREYSRRSRYDYYYPILANLGEQAVLNKEIYIEGDSTLNSDNEVIDDLVLGYQERWAEMRYKQSRITGITRSTVSTPLDVWHLGQKFSSLPVLNDEFIEEDGRILDRVIQVNGFTLDDGEYVQSNTPQFIANFYFNEYWIRPMPVFSIPSMSSHI